MGSPRPVRVIFLLALLGLLATAGPAGAWSVDQPYFYVSTGVQEPGAGTDLGLDFTHLAAGPTVEAITITAPVGYAFAEPPLGSPVGTINTYASPIAGGDPQDLVGNLDPELPDAIAADLASCAPGTHTAAWEAKVEGDPGTVTVPIAVDQRPDGTYAFTVCLDDFRAKGLVPDELYIAVFGVFTNPPRAGTYVWDALMTPFVQDGTTPDPASMYELRADEPLPETISAKPSYDARTHVLTVRGAVAAVGKARVGVHVHVYGGASDEEALELGFVTTAENGAYVFRKRLAKPPAIVDSGVYIYVRGCDAPSTAPGTCVNETTDGTWSGAVKVPKPKPLKPKPKKKPRRR